MSNFFQTPSIYSWLCNSHLNSLVVSRFNLVSSVVEWFERRDCDRHGLGLKPFCCVLGKDTLRHFPLLGALGKQF